MQRRLRVAQVGNYDPDSADGTEKVVVGLTSSLPRAGVDTEVWQLSQPRSQAWDFQVDGIPVSNRPAFAPPWAFVRGTTRAARNFVQHRRSSVDLVHFHSGLVPENVAIAAQLSGPYVISPQGAYNPSNLHGRHRWFKEPWLFLKERAYVDRAAFIHSVSPQEADSLRKVFPEARVVLVPAGVEAPPDLPDAVHRPGRFASPRDFVYLGRMSVEHKGLDLLVGGYAEFLNYSGDRETRLILVGPDFRGGLAELQALAARLGIGERVIFPGPAFGADRWAWLSGAYALIHPSRWEGLPNAVLEALAASCPVLVTPGTNLGDLVRQYEAGICVEGSIAGVREGLCTLIRLQPESHLRMGQGARRLIDERFTWANTARRLAEAYLEVCQRREPSSHQMLAAL
jgi:glycosyltransferase involved in cell wall biosynthesis